MSFTIAKNKGGAAQLAIPLGISAICIAILSVLFWSVSARLDSLREAPRDNVTWALSQVEVETLLLSHEAQRIREQSNLPVTDLSRKFDNLYSRIGLISQATIFADMRADKTFSAQLSALQQQVEMLANIFDQSNDHIRQTLPVILDELAPLRALAHDITLTGIRLGALTSDVERQSFARLLWFAAAITLSMIFLLGVLFFYQVRQNKAHKSISVEIERANHRLRSSFDVALDAIVVADDAGFILEYNHAAEIVFGYSRSEAIGQSMAELIIPHQYRDAHYAGMERYNATKEPKLVDQGRIEITALRKSGEEFPVEISIGHTQNERGSIFIGYLRDITDRLSAERDLKLARDDAVAAKKTQENFLAVMSHEMRTPLNGLFGIIELLRKTRLSKQQSNYLEIAKRSSDILLNHVNDVLDISRSDAGKMELRENVFELKTFLDDVITTNQATAFAKDNTLALELENIPETWIFTDEQKLRQIAFNLVSNALKFTKKGTVTLRASLIKNAAETRLHFSVEDNGVGISEENQKRVFERFFTQDQSYDRHATGAGLGLAICKQLIDMMDGSIALESTLGQGSTFSVNLPIKIGTPNTSKEPKPDEVYDLDHIQGQHILLVEDNEINRLIVREMLEAEGLIVSEAFDGKHALDFATQQKFAMIFMDVSMPNMNGIDATRTILASDGLNTQTPIIGLTAHALEEEQASFIAAGMRFCLNKPVSKNTLINAVCSVLTNETTVPKSSNEGKSLIEDHIFAELNAVLGSSKHKETVKKFGSEIEALIETLNETNAMEDLVNIGALAHKSVGSAGMIGALALKEVLFALEKAAKSGSLDDTQKAASFVSERWSETQAALQEMLD